MIISGRKEMIKLTNRIKSHQVVAFFIISFAIAWGPGFSYNAVTNQGMFFLALLVTIAICGPALAGIIITTIAMTVVQ
jgi:hypothetical protein